MEKQTRGLRNNNPFNIRKSKSRWLGKVKGSDKEFETFDTLEYGYRAGLVLLRTYYRKYMRYTYRDIIERFAPKCENNIDNYISYIWYNTHINPDAYISLETLLNDIAPYIALYESRLPFGVCKMLSSQFSPKLLNK